MAITSPSRAFVQSHREFQRRLRRVEVENLDEEEKSHEAVHIAGTLRHWYAEGQPLVPRLVKERRRVRVNFKIASLTVPVAPGDWFANDRLDPSIDDGGPNAGGIAVGDVLMTDRVLSDREIRALSMRRRRIIQTVGATTLLKTPIMRVEGKTITVRQVVRYLSHVEHGIHSGIARDPGEAEIEAVCSRLSIQGMSAVHSSIFAVGRIVSAGVEPLVADIEAT